MTWGEESPGDADRFAAKPLPPAETLDPERLALAGLGSAAPNSGDVRGEASGLVPAAASPGAASWRRRLAPRHRDAVKTFFSGPEAGKGESPR